MVRCIVQLHPQHRSKKKKGVTYIFPSQRQVEKDTPDLDQNGASEEAPVEKVRVQSMVIRIAIFVPFHSHLGPRLAQKKQMNR